MKKNLVKLSAIFLFSICATYANAQETSKYKKKSGPEFRFGVTAGATYSFQTGYDYQEDVSGIVGLTAGGFANYSFSEKLKLQIAAMYSQYGTNFTIDEEETSKERQSYLSIPLTLKGYLTEGFYLSVGPQVNILLSSKYNEHDLKDSTKKSDFGLVGGMGYHFTPNIGIDANYYYGLGNIYTEDLGIEEKINYNAFTLRLFYEF